MLNIEVKGNLARLLATENLVVEHRNVETAMFNVVDRVLTLPMWKRASLDVYDMLVGHEVGHALYTPQKFGQDYGIPQSYLNVVEDARIEKLMKRKFPGLSRNFYAGYQDLHNQDFFCIGDRSLDTYTLIDRINLYFKVGIHANEIFNFPEEEKHLVEMVSDAETFEDVVVAARAILEYTKEKEMDKVAEIPDAEELQQGNLGGQQSSSEMVSQPDATEEEGVDKSDSENEENQEDDISGAGDLGGDLKSETDQAFSESQKRLIQREWNDIHYIEMPPVSVNTLVVSNKTVMEDCEETYSKYRDIDFDWADSEYLKYRKEAQREVSYLVKEFEMRKSADQYARSSVSKTGVLDTSKLHTYKWNEDLFKKVNVVPDGKNHGLIFILDWSGSMGTILINTAKQILNIAWFCKKCQIPFDVYAFTNNYWHDRNFSYEDECVTPSERHHEKKTGYVEINSLFRLLNLVSSDGKNGKDLEHQLKNFWRLVLGESSYSGYNNPAGYGLSGTPLNESVIALTAIIPDFRKRTGVEKTNVIILTDGESQSINHIVEHNYGNGVVKYGTSHVRDNCVLRDRTTGNVYPSFEGNYYTCGKITEIFLKAVRNRFPDVNLIGIRLTSGRQLYSAISSSECPVPYEKIQKEWKKNKSVNVPDFSGYQQMYYLSSEDLITDNEFVVADDASKNEIKKAFTKSLAKKSVNKKMLTSFAELIS